MATIGVAPIMMKDATLTVAADDFTAAVMSVEFTPSPSWQQYVPWGGSPKSVLAYVRWSCRLGFLQDLAAGSLSRYLLAHVGETVTATFTPKSGGATVTASLVLAPGAIGGSANNLLSADVDIPVNGEPAVA